MRGPAFTAKQLVVARDAVPHIKDFHDAARVVGPHFFVSELIRRGIEVLLELHMAVDGDASCLSLSELIGAQGQRQKADRFRLSNRMRRKSVNSGRGFSQARNCPGTSFSAARLRSIGRAPPQVCSGPRRTRHTQVWLCPSNVAEERAAAKMTGKLSIGGVRLGF